MKLTLFLLIAISASAQTTPDAASIEGKILALENAWGQAEKAGDSKVLHDLLDDSMVYVRYDGAVWTKLEYLASLKEADSHVEQAVNENMTAHAFNDTVLVTRIYRIKGVEKGKPYSRRERFIDLGPPWRQLGLHRQPGNADLRPLITLIELGLAGHALRIRV